MTVTPPNNVTVRAPTTDDLDAINDLIALCALADDGTDAFTTPYQRSDWKWPGFQMETDAWVVSAPDGRLAGYASIWPGVQQHLKAEACIHPAARGRGIGSLLLHLIEQRARQMAQEQVANMPVTLLQEISSANTAAQQLLEQHGFYPTRHDWQMLISMSEAPPAPVWPAGITVRQVIPGQDEHAVYTVTEEAFAQNRGHVPMTFEQWAAIRLQPENFDPHRWFLALDGAEPAGVVLCRTQREMGWVSILAVRAPWRKQGLGMALLQQAFGEFYRQGRHTVGLSVDSENDTGATRLYKRAGMSIARQYDRYEKVLRPDNAGSPPAIAE